MKAILTVSLVCLTIGSFAQSALQIFEKKGTTLDSLEGKYAVGINSTLNLYLNKEYITQEAFRLSNKEAVDQLRELQVANDILEQYALVMSSIKERMVLQSSLASRDEIKQVILQTNSQMQQMFQMVVNQPALNQELTAAYLEYINNVRPLDPNEFLSMFLQQKVDNTKARLLTMKTESRVHFRLGGFLSNKSGGRPVHIPKFDNYQQGVFYEEPQWVTSITEEDKQRLEANKQLASELNEDFDGVIDSYTETIKAAFKSPACIKETAIMADALVDQMNQNALAVPDEIKAILQKTEVQITDLVNTYLSLDRAKEVLETRDIEKFKLLISEVEGELERIISELERDILGVADDLLVVEELKSFKQQVETCVANVKEDVNFIESTIEGFVKAIGSLNQAYLASSELGKEVKLFKIDNIPDSTTLDLRYTGQREVGDQIVFKAELVDKNEDGIITSTHPIANLSYELRKTFIYNEFSPVLINAQPTSINSKIDLEEGDWQYAAAMSVLIKIDSRKSKFWNEVLSPGVGLNYAFLDFDHDDDFDRAFGLGFALFRDVLQGGYGFNFDVDQTYYYVGLSVPTDWLGIKQKGKVIGQ